MCDRAGAMVRGKFKISSTLKNIIANTGYLFGLRVLRMVMALFVSVWVARYLGPERFGILSYSIAFVGLFSPLFVMGLQGILVRDIVRDPSSADEILGTAFILRLIGGLLCLILAVAVVSLVRRGDSLTRLLTAIIAAGMIFQAFECIDIWFQSQVQSKYPVYAKSAALMLSSIAKVVLILKGAGLVAFASVAALDVVVSALGLTVVFKLRGFHIRSCKFSLHKAGELLGQSWALVLSGALAMIYFKIDQVMLGQMSGEQEVGIYSTAVRLSETWYFVPVAITTSVFPLLIKSREMGKGIYEARLQQLYDFLAWISMILAVILTFAAGPLVRLVLGESYAASAEILAIHIWAGVFVFLKAVLGNWLLNEGRINFLFISNGLGAVVNVALNLYLIPAYGGRGAAVATVISYAATGYFACFLYPATRPAGKMMTLALLVPFRTPAMLIRGLVKRRRR